MNLEIGMGKLCRVREDYKTKVGNWVLGWETGDKEKGFREIAMVGNSLFGFSSEWFFDKKSESRSLALLT